MNSGQFYLLQSVNYETIRQEFIPFSDGNERVFLLCDWLTYPAGIGTESGHSSRRGNFITPEYQHVAGGVGWIRAIYLDSRSD
jgi:hypothetical protein